MLKSLCCVIDKVFDKEENEVPKCSVCQQALSEMVPVADLTSDTIDYILVYCEQIKELNDYDYICKRDLKHIENFKDDGENFETEFSGKLGHEENCGFCTASLVWESDQNSSVYDTVGVMFQPLAKNMKKHYHLSLDTGNVNEARHAFVKFVLKQRHKNSTECPKLSSCICGSCYMWLKRSFENKRKGVDSTKRKYVSDSSLKCAVKECNNISYKSLVTKPELMIKLFGIDSTSKTPLCKDHRLVYSKELFVTDRCLFCAQLLKKTAKNKKLTPLETTKRKYIALITEIGLEKDLPDDFCLKDYVFHKDCWRKENVTVQRAKGTDAIQGKSAKRQRVDSDGAANDIDVDDTETVALDYLNDLEEEKRNDSLFYEEEEEPTKNLSIEELKSKADAATLQFIKEELKRNLLTTRKTISDYWNNYLRTVAFENGHDLFDLVDCRGDRFQRRILRVYEPADPEETLQFTFIANKAKYETISEKSSAK